MVNGQHLNTRISQEAYKKLMQKCSEEGCSTYEYLRQLVNADIGLLVEEDPEEPAGKQTLLKRMLENE